MSLPKEIDFEGQRVITCIFEEPIEGREMLRTLNLDGDKQADLTVHGGPGMEMPFGMFGENLTIEGLMENGVSVGDIFEIGSSKVMA